MLFNKKATKYAYSRDSKGVASYSQSGTTFACNIQPLTTKDGLSGTDFLKTRKIYTKNVLNVGDKIVCDGITYIVDSSETRDGTKRKFFKSFIVESNGN